jgi:hypothetical protein
MLFGGLMPTYFIHLSVAKKVNPNAGLDFFIGNLAPDSVSGKDKDINHFRNEPDMESALKKFAQTKNIKNEYLKGFLLHLFVDWKWNDSILVDFAKKEGDGWYKNYYDEGGLIESYGCHNTEWAYRLREQMDLCTNFNYVETEFVTEDGIKAVFENSYKWKVENKTEPSSAFPPELIEKFAADTADDFIKWFSEVA